MNLEKRFAVLRLTIGDCEDGEIIQIGGMTEKSLHPRVLCLCDPLRLCVRRLVSKTIGSQKGTKPPRTAKQEELNLRAALPAILVAVVPAMSDVNPANADVA